MRKNQFVAVAILLFYSTLLFSQQLNTSLLTYSKNCPDLDRDGICNEDDLCPGFNDLLDHDSDGIPDGCDDDCLCLALDCEDADLDGVKDDCDICEGGDDSEDSLFNGIPDDCDDACSMGELYQFTNSLDEWDSEFRPSSVAKQDSTGNVTFHQTDFVLNKGEIAAYRFQLNIERFSAIVGLGAFTNDYNNGAIGRDNFLSTGMGNVPIYVLIEKSFNSEAFSDEPYDISDRTYSDTLFITNQFYGEAELGDALIPIIHNVNWAKNNYVNFIVGISPEYNPPIDNSTTVYFNEISPKLTVLDLDGYHSDNDLVRDLCDKCDGFNDKLDNDADGVPDGCDDDCMCDFDTTVFPVIASGDDAQENNGVVNPDALTLIIDNEMQYDLWGLRFQNFTFSTDQIIRDAYIEFTTDTASSSIAGLKIYLEESNTISNYTNQNISSRTYYEEPVNWQNFEDWTSVGEKVRSPNLKNLILTHLDLNNSEEISFKLRGKGNRSIQTFDKSPANAPKLVINFCNEFSRDNDKDGVKNECDICEGYNDFDKRTDSDSDGIPDVCDICNGMPDLDEDRDGVCDYIDDCWGFDDALDKDGDEIPDGCDICPDTIANFDYNKNLICDFDEVCIDSLYIPYFEFDGNYKAAEEIKTKGQIYDTKKISLKAGRQVILDNYFGVFKGGEFEADIEPCQDE